MRNPSKDMSVFEFEQDEVVDAANKLSKYQFLQTCASGIESIDLLEGDSPERFTPDRNQVSAEEISELDDAKECSTSYDTHTKTCTSDYGTGRLLQEDDLAAMGASRLLVASAYDDEDPVLHSPELPINLMENAGESCTSTSEDSSTTGDFTENDGHPKCLLFEHCQSTCEEMDDNTNTVALFPDYVICRDKLFLEAHLTFCSDCIKIECSDACGTDEKLNIVCDIANIVRIGCQKSRSVDALLFKFWIKIDVERDPEKFVASMADMFWLEKELKIKSLAERYTDIWDFFPDNNRALDDGLFRTHRSFSNMYFTEIMEPFEDVIYPKGDPDAVSLSKRDIELLEPETFINDTIIDFYIKYLQDKVQPIKKPRFHFFNCFFFRKLADLDKDPGSISEGRAAYQRVRKWTRRLNLFDKDYIFIPVNFNLHWSLLVICHPGEIITFDDDLQNSTKVPCILHMDSLKGNHKGLEKLIHSYLLEEWKGRNSEIPDDITSRFSNLRFVHLELPQQENSSDCGLFLLHYVELFLEEAPLFFNPIKISKSSNFAFIICIPLLPGTSFITLNSLQLSADWFPPSEASFKRFHIRGLINEILRDSSQKLPPTSSNEDFPCLDDDAKDVDQAVQFLSAPDNPSKAVNGSTSKLPSTAQDDIVDQIASFKSSPAVCTTVNLGDTHTEVAGHMELDADADSAQPPAASQISSTLFYDISSSSEQVKDAAIHFSSTRSSDELASSNARDGTRNPMSPTAVGCAFVPDTPDITYQQHEAHVKSSLADVGQQIEPQSLRPTTKTDSETLREGESEKTDMEETDTLKKDEDLIEISNGEKREDTGSEGVVVVADCQQKDDIKESSKGGKRHSCEVAISDNDWTPSKRSRVSALSVQRASKREKRELEGVRPRVTRSTLRKRGS